LNFQTKITGV